MILMKTPLFPKAILLTTCLMKMQTLMTLTLQPLDLSLT